MATSELMKDLKELYNPSVKEVTLVDVPPMNFLMIDGEGNPNIAPEYAAAVEALYGLSYTLKFRMKKGPEALDYKVGPLEGLWWTDNMAEFSVERKEDWKWTMMVSQPDFITPELVEEARTELIKKKKELADTIRKVRFERFEEGSAAQLMHIGPYSAEGSNIARLHQFIREKGYEFDGIQQKHHEIYLGDPRRTAPEKLKTILRQPFVK